WRADLSGSGDAAPAGEPRRARADRHDSAGEPSPRAAGSSVSDDRAPPRPDVRRRHGGADDCAARVFRGRRLGQFSGDGGSVREDASDARPRDCGRAGETALGGNMLRSTVMSLLVAASIVAAAQKGLRADITVPVMFDTPEADRILSMLKVFPPDNA